VVKDLTDHYSPSEFFLGTLFNNRISIEFSKLQFICHLPTIDLAGPKLKHLRDARKFKLYEQLQNSSNFQKAIWILCTRVSIFIGLQFPCMVTSIDEIVELFHAVI